jgi:hypothetical protein
MLLLITMLWHNVRYRAQRLRDQETGAINTVELLVLIGVIVALVIGVIAILRPRIEGEARTVDLG